MLGIGKKNRHRLGHEQSKRESKEMAVAVLKRQLMESRHQLAVLGERERVSSSADSDDTGCPSVSVEEVLKEQNEQLRLQVERLTVENKKLVAAAVATSLSLKASNSLNGSGKQAAFLTRAGSSFGLLSPQSPRSPRSPRSPLLP